MIKALRRNKAVPAISLSGFGMESDFQQSRAAGFAEHLVKPIDLRQLREASERQRRTELLCMLSNHFPEVLDPLFSGENFFIA